MAKKKTKKEGKKPKKQRIPIPKKVKPTQIIALIIGLFGSVIIFFDAYMASVYFAQYLEWFFGSLMFIGAIIMIQNRMTTMGARLVFAAALLEILVGGGYFYLGTVLGLVSGSVALYSEK